MAESSEKKQKARSAKAAFIEIAERLKSCRSAPSEGVGKSLLERYSVLMEKCGYEMSPETIEVLYDYLSGYNLWLCGRVGVGKTYFFECINKIRDGKGMEPMSILSMLETQGWSMDDAKDWVDSNFRRDVVIDDLGSEPEMSSYGMKAELFPYLLERRMHCPRRTHLTSNIGPKDVLARYKKRVSDRFVQFFKMEEFKCVQSRRALRPWARPVECEVVR